MQEVAAQAEYVEEKFRKRDRGGIWSALALIPISIGSAIWFPQPLVKLSWVLTIPCCLLLIYLLQQGSRSRITDFSVPLDQYLHQYHRYLQEQIEMLQRMVLWCVLPFSLCQLLYFYGLGRDTAHMIINIIIMFFLNFLLYRRNQKTLEEDLQPLLAKVEETLLLLEKD